MNPTVDGDLEPPAAEVARCHLATAHDVFVVRQLGRDVAEAVGLGPQDRTRVATVLSELGRELIEAIGPAEIVFGVDPAERVPCLVITLSWEADPGAAELAAADAAERLMDRVEHGANRIVLRKALAANSVPVDHTWQAQVRARIASVRPRSAMEELRLQNQELLSTLEDLHHRSQELQRLNAELEETNQGVVALYGELSRELEETNRGVVALYSELEDKSEQLREASETKSRFWANVSHELRTPVNSVIGLARLLLDPTGGPLGADQRRQGELIAESGATLLDMVNELLDMAKAESGRVEATLAPIDPVELLDRVRSMMRPVVTSPDVTLSVEAVGELPPIVTDEVMLTRILHNLLSNAVKYTEAGEISLTVVHEVRAARLVMTVSDSGIGIAPDQQGRVFEEFYQVPGPLQAHAPGTGLGLPYARSLTKLLGGTLTLDSAVGRGTTVTLLLPTGTDPDGRPTRRIGTALLIDDDPAFRELFRALARELVDRLVEVPGGTDALTTAQACAPDVIFLDLYMPDVDGFELLRRLALHPELAPVPVVVITAAEPDRLPDRSELDFAASVTAKAGLTARVLSQILTALPRDEETGGAS
ncbi:ATP-binding protein [Streptomyces sp. SID3343]|uniref:ATP-binding protein n=1 Tax=Streptomyces sp. SID3343 TaxID=2690260 RepID=UPI001368C261|nr:ATP-binding protein [Streptomyces sp. SID3343]MYV98738.1 response regulator [Streptomyces sp. SID3343]